ncbi:MAG: SDR family oxidoreductase [Clostridia bacterium]|nr:SDR family oxidoreductase [Clostridia bacterium]
MFDLSGKTALVTGSTQGIGYAVAKVLAEAGAKVFVHCSADREKARRVAKEIGAYEGVTADLSDPAEAKSLPEKTGGVDILVTNASVQFRKKWTEIGEEEFERQINVNLRSTLLLMQGYYPYMKANGWGRMITIGSVQQTKPHPDMAVYAATNSAAENVVRNVAQPVAQEGITVNNVAPGVIATPRNEEALSDDAYRAKVLAGIPAGYAGEGGDIAGTVLLLASNEGRYLTGADIPVAGGMDC